MGRVSPSQKITERQTWWLLSLGHMHSTKFCGNHHAFCVVCPGVQKRAYPVSGRASRTRSGVPGVCADTAGRMRRVLLLHASQAQDVPVLPGLAPCRQQPARDHADDHVHLGQASVQIFHKVTIVLLCCSSQTSQLDLFTVVPCLIRTSNSNFVQLSSLFFIVHRCIEVFP